MRTIIAGSRRIPSLNVMHPDQWNRPQVQENMMELLEEAVRRSGFQITAVLSGNCWGIDHLGEKYAQKHGIPLEKFPAAWGQFGKKAGIIRNEQMAEKAEGLICLCTENSSGSLHMIECMKNMDKPYFAMIIE